MAYCADPSCCLLSSLKNGHGKTAAAHVLDEQGQPVALLLGPATHVQQKDLKFDGESSEERSRLAQAASSVSVTKRARKTLQGAVGAISERSSQRVAAKEQNIAWPDILNQHSKRGSGVNPDIEKLQAADIGGIFKLMVNILKGRQGDNDNAWQANPDSTDSIRIQLLKYCLEGNPAVNEISLRDHRGCGSVEGLKQGEGSLQIRQPVEALLESGHKDLEFRNLNPQHRKLLHLLAYISKNLKSGITADSVLEQFSLLFEDFKPPTSEYPHGLDSAPAATREPLSQCAPLMRAIEEGVIHYFVEGVAILWRGQEVTTISIWLVYTWKEDKKEWDRALFTAEQASKNAIVAIYKNRLLLAIEQGYVSTTHALVLPCRSGSDWVGFDGKPRAVDAERKNMASRTLACYANSVRDANNQGTAGINCTREWDPDWRQYSTDRSVANPPTDARMGLKLLKDVDAYVPLLYRYDWNKEHERKERAKTSSALEALAQECGKRSSRP